LELQSQLDNILSSLSFFIPEVLLSLAFLSLIIIDLFLHKSTNKVNARIWMLPCTLIVLAINFYQVAQQFFLFEDGLFLFNKMLFIDAKAIFFKCLIGISGLLTLIHIYVTKKEVKSEFYIIFVGLMLGLNILTMAINLLMIYISLETVSIASYLLASLKKDRFSSEAGLKYLLFGIAASAVMLYGMSLLYGITGTLNVANPEFSRGISLINPVVVYVAIFLTISGFLFKLSAVPFHVWTPDIYQAAPPHLVAFLSVAPKIAAVLALMRLYFSLPIELKTATCIISGVSILVGNFTAIWQKDAKRLLAYSSIAQVGFILIGLAILSENSMNALLFFLIIYLFSNHLVFLMVDIVGEKFGENYDLNKYIKLGNKNALLGILFVLVMISLAGLPPMAGFFAKFNIFSALWEGYQNSGNKSLLLLLVFALLNTAISLFFYLKIPYLMFFKKSSGEIPTKINVTIEQWCLLIFLTTPLLLFFFKADWLINLLIKI
jgi:NADH-quinone oxidoreductase subunit N